MRAVKDGLPTPYAEVEESERPRSTGAVEPTAGILPIANGKRITEAVRKAAADESTGGVTFLTLPSRAAKTARFPSGLR
jgi:hypothetical protein